MSFLLFTNCVILRPSGVGKQEEDEWVAVVSGLDIGSSTSSDAQVQLLVEYLVSELGGDKDVESSSRISRLIIAGSSLAPVDLSVIGKENEEADKRSVGTSRRFTLNLIFLDSVDTEMRPHSLHTQCKLSRRICSILPV